MGRYLIIPFVAVIITFVGGFTPLVLAELFLTNPEIIPWDIAYIVGLGLGILFLWKATGLNLRVWPASKTGFKRVLQYSMLAAFALIAVDLFVSHFWAWFDWPPYETDGIVELLSVLLIAPVLEELFFRGYLYVYIRDNIGIGAAMGIVTLLFFLGHESGGSMLLILALLLIYVYEKTGCLASSILIHMIWNAYVVLPQFLYR